MVDRLPQAGVERSERLDKRHREEEEEVGGQGAAVAGEAGAIDREGDGGDGAAGKGDGESPVCIDSMRSPSALPVRPDKRRREEEGEMGEMSKKSKDKKTAPAAGASSLPSSTADSSEGEGGGDEESESKGDVVEERQDVTSVGISAEQDAGLAEDGALGGNVAGGGVSRAVGDDQNPVTKTSEARGEAEATAVDAAEDGKEDARNAEDENQKDSELHATDQRSVARCEQLAAGRSAAEDRSLEGACGRG